MRRAAGPAAGSRPPSRRGRSRSACIANGRLRHTRARAQGAPSPRRKVDLAGGVIRLSPAREDVPHGRGPGAPASTPRPRLPATAHIRYDCCALPREESPMNDMRRVHAEQLVSSLELSLPPVAIAFCDVVPDDVPMFEGVVPAGCAFWSHVVPDDVPMFEGVVPAGGRRPRRAPSRQPPVTTPCARLASTRIISRARRPRSRRSCTPRSRP